MTCSRCHGLMIVDAFIDMDDDTGQLWMGAARCLNCGEVVDLGIARNRAGQAAGLPPSLSRTRARRSRWRTLYPVRLTA